MLGGSFDEAAHGSDHGGLDTDVFESGGRDNYAPFFM